MNIFISWSGKHSRALAEILRHWIPGVIQAVKPYFTPDDIAKGARWSDEITTELEKSVAGLICLTPDNIEAPWIMFEAGALSKSLGKTRVCPILFDVDATDLKGPLIQFQAAKFERAEIRRVMRMINENLGEISLQANVLDSVFDMWWPRLKEAVDKELDAYRTPTTVPSRSDRDILEELLQLARSNADSRNPNSFAPNTNSFMLLTSLIAAYEEHIADVDNKQLIASLYKSLEQLRVSIEQVLPALVPVGPRGKALIERFDNANRALNAMDQRHRFQLDEGSDLFGAE